MKDQKDIVLQTEKATLANSDACNRIEEGVATRDNISMDESARKKLVR